jgi:hypothetical protein
MRYCRSNMSSNFGASSEAHKRYLFIVYESFSDDWTCALTQSSDVLKPMLLKNFIYDSVDSDWCKWRRLSAFPNQLVTTDQSQGCIPSVDRTRKVKCWDDTDVAYRIPLFYHHVVWSLTRYNFTTDSARHTYSHVAYINKLLNFTVSFRFDFPDLERNQWAQRMLFSSEIVADLPYNFTSYRHRKFLPLCPVGFHRSYTVVVVQIIP